MRRVAKGSSASQTLRRRSARSAYDLIIWRRLRDTTSDEFAHSRREKSNRLLG